jgi:hypothetical protein
MMDEVKFTERIRKYLADQFPQYEITANEALLYKIIVNENGVIQPDNPLQPKRGNFAFQTDLLIKKEKLPIVVCELKYGGFSTHDILTYSTKAVQHKEIYPYLRYGLLAGNTNALGNRFFTHNAGFDFAFAMTDKQDGKELSCFKKIIQTQIENAELLLDRLNDRHTIKLFNTTLEIKRVQT